MGIDVLSKNPNYTSDAKDLLLDQFKNSTNYNKVLNVLSSVMQDFENIIVESSEARLFGNAVGEQLDEIGRQLGVARTVEDDNQYRAILALNALRLTNKGTRDELYNILASYAAQSVEFVVGNDSQLDINMFAACISSILGVNAIIELLPIGTYYRILDVQGVPFGFDDDDGGFGSIHDPTAGGSFTSLLAQSED